MSPRSPAPGLAHFRKSLIAGFTFSAFINILLLSMPLYSLQVFSRAIPSGNTDTLLMLSVLVLIALTIMAVLEVARGRIFSRAATYLEIAFRPRLTELSIDAGARGRQDWGAIRDLNEVRGFLNRPTLSALCDLPWMPVYAVWIYLIDPALFGIMLVGSLALIGLALLGHSLTRDDHDEAIESAGRAARMFDALSARSEIIRALRMQSAAVNRWAADNAAGVAASGAAQERSATVSAVQKWVRYILQVAVTGVGALLVMDNRLSMGGMIATSLLVGRAMSPVEQIAGAWGATQKALGAWKRLSPVLKRISREAPAVAQPAGPGDLHVVSATVQPRLDRPAILVNVTFNLPPGEVLCVLGPNRAGKTMLARLLTGASKPLAGAVRLDGAEVSAWRPSDPYHAIGYVPQHIEWLPGTIGRNIARFLPDDGSGVVKAARMAGVHDIIAALPAGYDTDITEAPLQGGTERLIALARALFGHPALVVLDSPDAYADIPAVEAMRQAIKRCTEDRITTVVLSQQSIFLDVADKVMILVAGAVQAFGPRDKVVSQRKPVPPPAPAPEAKSVEKNS